MNVFRIFPRKFPKRLISKRVWRLGDTCDPFPEKPKWMRWAAYNRIANDLEAVGQEIDMTSSYSVARAGSGTRVRRGEFFYPLSRA